MEYRNPDADSPQAIGSRLIDRRIALYPCLVRFFLLLLLAGGLTGHAASTANVAGTGARATRPSRQFAIADFDGDTNPDFASVQAGSERLGITDYSIDFDLTAFPGHSIRVAAASGGLTITASDVNGDHAVDLVIAAAISKEPVAILLNDGHGDFSRATPAEFPAAFVRPLRTWRVASNYAGDSRGVPAQSRGDIWWATKTLADLGLQNRSIGRANQPSCLAISAISQPGRAPPSFGANPLAV